MSTLQDRIAALITSLGTDVKALSKMSVPFSSGGSLIVKVGSNGWTNRLGRTLTITEVYLEVGTAPTGSALICDVNKNGTSIWNTTQANRAQVAAGASSGSSTTFDTTSIAQGDRLTFDVDQIGSTVAGADLTLQVVMR